MDQRLKTIHYLGIASFLTTFIMGATEGSVLSLFAAYVSAHIAAFVTLHYVAVIIAVVLYFVIISKISAIVQQKLLKQFGFGLLFVIAGVILLLMDFGMANGASALTRPNLPAYVLIFIVLAAGLILIIRGGVMICKIYTLIAVKIGSIYFKLSSRLIALSVILFLVFLLSWMFVGVFPDSQKYIVGLIGFSYSLSYALGQLLFSLGAAKLKLSVNKITPAEQIA